LTHSSLIKKACHEFGQLFAETC